MTCITQYIYDPTCFYPAPQQYFTQTICLYDIHDTRARAKTNNDRKRRESLRCDAQKYRRKFTGSLFMYTAVGHFFDVSCFFHIFFFIRGSLTSSIYGAGTRRLSVIIITPEQRKANLTRIESFKFNSWSVVTLVFTKSKVKTVIFYL